jgi:hypothetical protein
MGQYYKVVNTTKKQVMNPHSFGSGAKLVEFSFAESGIMSGLAILLADGNGRGTGDIDSKNPLIGSWAGDSIVITGDYADKGKFVQDEKVNLYDEANDYEDISFKVIEALCDHYWFKQDYYENWKLEGFNDWNQERQSFKEKLFGKQLVTK